MWLFDYLSSSIGKKQSLGLAGALLAGFLGVHAVGNLALLNPDPAAAQAAYNAYTEFLTHTLRPLIWFAEAGLAALFLCHIGLAIRVKLENLKAAGCNRYAVRTRLNDEGLPSRTMFVTGALVLVFLLQHLLFFKYGTHHLYRDAAGKMVRDMWLTTAQAFSDPVWMALYVVALVLLGTHLWHALPSVCRTFGLVHAKWTPFFNWTGRVAALGVAGLFLASALGTCALVRTDSWQKQIRQATAAQAILSAEVAK